jgi:NAD(P)-dependent dehydrogenase (short-subunit alcohol dehydrogenase family)
MASAIYPSLKDKGVLVTGGGSGIGAALVRNFAAQGTKVGFLDNNETASQSLVDELARAGTPVHFVNCDLTDIAALDQAIARIRTVVGPLTGLVNNAAHDQRHTVDEVTSDYWDQSMAINLKHQFFAAKAVLPDMKQNGGGSILNTGSISWMLGQAGMVCYTTAKSAIAGLTRSLAREFGPFNIRVNCIAPGWIMTDRQMELWLNEKKERQLLEDQCLKRKLYPDDVARVALFLISDDASACTNQTYIVDGGWV